MQQKIQREAPYALRSATTVRGGGEVGGNRDGEISFIDDMGV